MTQDLNLPELRRAVEEHKRRNIVGSIVFQMPTDELDALLDRLERAEAELNSVPQFSRAALLEFNAKYCLNKPDLIACAESAFYWFNKCNVLKGAAAGAVPEGAITGDEVTTLAHKLIRELTTELGECEDDEALNYCARGIGSLNADILKFIKARAAAPSAPTEAHPKIISNHEKTPANQGFDLSLSDVHANLSPAPTEAAPAQGDTAEPSAFRQHLERTSKIVEGWPDWKKGMWGAPAAAPSEPTEWIGTVDEGGRTVTLRERLPEGAALFLTGAEYDKASDSFIVRAAPSEPVAPIIPKWEGQFDSFQQWVNKAQSWLASPSHRPAVCIDAKGRRCAIGADFMRARDEDAFPVRYFWECELFPTPPAQDAGTGDALLIELRDWFEAQRKAISKGCGSTWDMGQCADQIEKIDRAIANSGRTE